jgi:hypothetical protein
VRIEREHANWYNTTVVSISRSRGHLLKYDSIPGEDEMTKHHDLAVETWR